MLEIVTVISIVENINSYRYFISQSPVHNTNGDLTFVKCVITLSRRIGEVDVADRVKTCVDMDNEMREPAHHKIQ